MPMPSAKQKTQFVRLLNNGARVVNNNFDILQSNHHFEDNCLEVNSTGCTTCKGLYQVYEAKNVYPPLLSAAKQCIPIFNEIQTQVDEGCEISSSFRTIKLGAEFHISPGIPFNDRGLHQHLLNVFDLPIEKTNLTHTIERLQFSKTNELMPLDNFTNIQIKQKMWRVTYAIDILGNGFTASKFALKEPKSKTPGIIFKYEVSPITAISYEDRQPLLHLFTRLLTVIGAVLGTVRVIDNLCYTTVEKKPEVIQ